MGQSVSWLSGLIWSKKEIRILILGLDNAGKTTLLYRLKIGEVVTTIPTIGFNVESVTYKNLNFNVWDLGGQTSIRPYWRCYYANTAAVIFVVDSTDIERLQTAADELAAMLNEDELKDASLLVFANKQDQPGAKGAGDISQALRLGELRDRNWSIMACSAVDGSGVNEGMDWLVVSVLLFFFALLSVRRGRLCLARSKPHPDTVAPVLLRPRFVSYLTAVNSKPYHKNKRSTSGRIFTASSTANCKRRYLFGLDISFAEDDMTHSLLASAFLGGQITVHWSWLSVLILLVDYHSTASAEQMFGSYPGYSRWGRRWNCTRACHLSVISWCIPSLQCIVYEVTSCVVCV
ncbi:hypothetical protein RB595_005657 [Gaeumannomyces hyphopodioides]